MTRQFKSVLSGIILILSSMSLISCNKTLEVSQNIMQDSTVQSLIKLENINNCEEIESLDEVNNYLDNLRVYYNLPSGIDNQNLTYDIIENENNGAIIVYYNDIITLELWEYTISENNTITNLVLSRNNFSVDRGE